MKKELIIVLLIVTTLGANAQINLGLGFGLQNYYSLEKNYSSFPSAVTPQIDIEVGFPIKDSTLRIMSGISYYSRAKQSETPTIEQWTHETLLSIPIMLYFNFDVKKTLFAPGLGFYTSLPVVQNHYLSDNSTAPSDFTESYTLPYIKFGLCAEFLYFIQKTDRQKIALGIRATYENDNLSINQNNHPEFYYSSLALRVVIWR